MSPALFFTTTRAQFSARKKNSNQPHIIVTPVLMTVSVEYVTDMKRIHTTGGGQFFFLQASNVASSLGT